MAASTKRFEQGLLDRPVEFVLHTKENSLHVARLHDSADGFKYLVDQGCGQGVAGAYSSDNAIIHRPPRQRAPRYPCVGWARTEPDWPATTASDSGTATAADDAALCVAWLKRHGCERVFMLNKVSPEIAKGMATSSSRSTAATGCDDHCSLDFITKQPARSDRKPSTTFASGTHMPSATWATSMLTPQGLLRKDAGRTGVGWPTDHGDGLHVAP